MADTEPYRPSPLRGFKNEALALDEDARGYNVRGWIVVYLTCGCSFKALAGRDAWHAALMHLRFPKGAKCERKPLPEGSGARAMTLHISAESGPLISRRPAMKKRIQFTMKELEALHHAIGNCDPSDLRDFGIDEDAWDSAAEKVAELLDRKERSK